MDKSVEKEIIRTMKATLPKVLQDIIKDQKAQLDHTEQMGKVDGEFESKFIICEDCGKCSKKNEIFCRGCFYLNF
jgi:hypothetical protein